MNCVTARQVLFPSLLRPQFKTETSTVNIEVVARAGTPYVFVNNKPISCSLIIVVDDKPGGRVVGFGGGHVYTIFFDIFCYLINNC